MLLQFRSLESIYTRMFIVICAAVIPTFLGLCFHVYQQHNYLLEYTKKTALNYASLTAHDESWLFTSTHQALRIIASTKAVQQRNWPACNQFLENLLKNQTTYINLGVVGMDGEALCEGTRAPEILGSNFADRGYFQKAVATRGAVVGDYQVGRLTRRPMIMVAMPLIDSHQNVQGVLYAALNLAAITQGRHTSQFAPDARLSVLDRNGIVLNSAPPDPEAIGKRFQDDSILAHTAENGNSSEVFEYPGGSKWLVSHTHAGVGNDPNALTIIYQQPLDSVLQGVNKTFWISGAISLTLTILALLIGWAGIQTLVGRNVRCLTTAAKRFGQRKFDTHIGNALTGLEFKEIGRRFDAMARELSKQERQWAVSMQRQQGQNRILRMVAQNTPLTDILKELTHFAEEQNDGVLACILLLAPDGQHVESCIAPSLPKSYRESLVNRVIGPMNGSCGAAMYESRVIIDHDLHTSPHWDELKEFALQHDLRACWSHPILSPEGRVLGSVGLYSRAPRRPSLEDLQSGQMAAELAAVALEHSRQRHALHYQSRHDLLTGLYNRTVLLAHIAQAISDAHESNGQVTIFILDLDGFKEINDTLGHVLGDNLLKQVSERLRNITGFNADIARTGSNEFTFLIRDKDAGTSIQDIVESTLALIKQPYLLDGIQVQISASAGVARFPQAGPDPNALTRLADQAMRQAKLEGSGYKLHDPALADTEPQRLLMLSYLRKALADDEFILHYQPKLSLTTNRIMGFEALLRWQNPVRGLLLPSEFIPTMELSDLIHPVTIWVIENAVKQCKIWQQAGYSFIIAANISARNLLDQQLPEKIGAILARHDLDAGFLELEITESSLIADPDRSFDVLRRLHEIGVQLSIDDFGTGYSSLAYLQKLPVDSLKIDRSFVMDSGQGREGRSIVGSIIGLAHNLRVSVTAEGVEDEASLQLLRDLGCDHAQGYYISRPLPVENVCAWLEDAAWEPAQHD